MNATRSEWEEREDAFGPATEVRELIEVFCQTPDAILLESIVDRVCHQSRPMSDETIARHVRKYCGTPDMGWSDPASGIFVGRYPAVPDEDLTTFLSAGLGSHVLTQPASGIQIRQEILLSVRNHYKYLQIQNVIFVVASLLLEKHLPIPRGQVIWPLPALFPQIGGTCSGLFCGHPGFFPDDFVQIELEVPLIFVEVYPITELEFRFIEMHGSDNFEEAVEDGEFDLLNLAR